MRPELQEAIDWWSATDDAITPFDEVEANPKRAVTTALLVMAGVTMTAGIARLATAF